MEVVDAIVAVPRGRAGRFPSGAVFVRVFLLIALFQGFGAIKALKAADARKDQADAF